MNTNLMHKGHHFRHIDADDLEFTLQLHNEPSTLMQLTDPRIISREQQRAWITNIINSRTSLRLIITAESVEADGSAFGCQKPMQPCGVVRVDCIDTINRSVMLGLDIISHERGKGHALISYEFMLWYLFEMCSMHRIYLSVLSTNHRAHELYKGLGFKEEGISRDAIFRNGKFNDYIMMGMLEDEYRAAVAANTICKVEPVVC